LNLTPSRDSKKNYEIYEIIVTPVTTDYSSISSAVANACVACREINSISWSSKSGYPLRRCPRCGVIFVAPSSLDASAHSQLYDHYYDGENPIADAVVSSSLNRLALSFESCRQTNRWVDFGYGGGDLLDVAESHQWSCYGVEISGQVLESGRKRGWIVTRDCEKDDRFPEGGFDVVTMIEFLEHVSSPDSFFILAARLLRRGGLLYLTTPNARSINRWLLGSKWSIFSPPEHVTIWTKRALRVALARAGFSDAAIRSEGFNPTEILTQFRSTPSPEIPVNRNEAGRRLNSAFSSTPFRRRVKAGINQGLSALNLGDRLKVRAILTDKKVEGCD
jgi:SAM-dependent methyltransferase